MIGERLRKLRMQRELAQTELSRILNVHPKAIMNWESDIVDPNIDNVCRLADYFQVSVDYLVGRDDDSKIWLGMLETEDKRKLSSMIQAYMNACARDELL